MAKKRYEGLQVRLTSDNQDDIVQVMEILKYVIEDPDPSNLFPNRDDGQLRQYVNGNLNEDRISRLLQIVKSDSGQ